MNFIKKIRENLKDPKKKALTQLGLYAIFFVFVFMLINNNPSSNVNYLPEKEEGVNNYEYIYKINNNGIIMEVIGTKRENEEAFTYNGVKYYIKDNITYLNQDKLIPLDTQLEFNTSYYSYKNIESLINNSEFVEKTIYKDDSEKITYNISIQKYFELLGDTTSCTLVDCTNILTNITINKSEYINKAVIDLSGFYGYTYNIEITYNNINNISKISTN